MLEGSVTIRSSTPARSIAARALAMRAAYSSREKLGWTCFMLPSGTGQDSNGVPDPDAWARLRASTAIAVSWTPVPVRSQSVIASALGRPDACPATT